MNSGAPHKPLLACLLALALTGAGGILLVASAAAAPPRARIARRHHERAMFSRIVDQCPNAMVSVTDAATDTVRAAVACLINGERRQHGLPTLAPAQPLATMAQSWSVFMVAHDEYDHNRFTHRLSAVAYDWATAGENIASGYATPRSVVAAWMASREHCVNILDPEFRDMGVGAVGAPVPSAANMGGTWTLDMGRRADQSALSTNSRPQGGCPYFP